MILGFEIKKRPTGPRATAVKRRIRVRLSEIETYMFRTIGRLHDGFEQRPIIDVYISQELCDILYNVIGQASSMTTHGAWFTSIVKSTDSDLFVRKFVWRTHVQKLVESWLWATKTQVTKTNILEVSCQLRGFFSEHWFRR